MYARMYVWVGGKTGHISREALQKRKKGAPRWAGSNKVSFTEQETGPEQVWQHRKRNMGGGAKRAIFAERRCKNEKNERHAGREAKKKCVLRSRKLGPSRFGNTANGILAK